MAALRRLHEGAVRDDEIDVHGHMNVRCYLDRALAASRALATELGLGADDCDALGAVLELRDGATRYAGEQTRDAPLATSERSDVWSVAPTSQFVIPSRRT